MTQCPLKPTTIRHRCIYHDQDCIQFINKYIAISGRAHAAPPEYTHNNTTAGNAIDDTSADQTLHHTKSTQYSTHIHSTNPRAMIPLHDNNTVLFAHIVRCFAPIDNQNNAIAQFLNTTNTHHSFQHTIYICFCICPNFLFHMTN